MMNQFAAIDFETANEQPCSVCSVGVVIVRGGEIVDSFYSHIHPEPEYYRWFCQRVHRLGPAELPCDSHLLLPHPGRELSKFLYHHKRPFDDRSQKSLKVEAFFIIFALQRTHLTIS